MNESEQKVSSGQRVDYLDNLRALAMLLGVYLHAALAYAHPSQSFWLATDPQSRTWIDISIWWIHLFRMSLFFVLSGYFGKMIYQRRGWVSFLTSRAIRIVGPFVLFYPLLLVAVTLCIAFALAFLKQPQGLIGLIAAAQAGGQSEADPPGTMHLWFLYYLFWFALLSLILAPCQWLSRLLRRLPRSLVWLAPLLLAPTLIVAGNPLPAPESFVPVWWSFAFYGLFYLAGWQWFGNEDCLDSWARRKWYWLGLSVLLFIPYYLLLPPLDLAAVLQKISVVNSQTVFVSILAAYLSALLTLLALVFGRDFLNRRSGVLRFIADSSYWVYLVHLPVVVFLPTLLIPLPWPAELKLLLVLVATLVACWTTYLVFVRYTPLGWMLHGKRKFP